ncbi:unnamed protein product [Camellia sinensis]
MRGHPKKFVFDSISNYSSYVFKTNLLGPQTVVFAGATGNKFLFSNENRLVQAWWPSSVYKVFPSSTQTSSKQEADIADKILGLLIAGHGTASSTCASIVMFLAELPHVYQRVYEEQMEIAKSKAPGELLNWDDIKKMKYSWNVACEVMRLAPPLQGAFREAVTDFMYNDFSIPKGCKKFFFEPHKFDPSRFEGSEPVPCTYVPFGRGPRMCPGKEYARLKILVFMYNLVKRFKWEKVIPNEKIVFDPMPNPEKGLLIRLFPRKA